jgi:lipid-A-disaccharide synthase
MHRALDQGADLLVVIDAPDFNLPLARAARKRGIPVVFYVSPKVWAWRAGRAKEIATIAETVLCLFDFEPAWYTCWGGSASFVGHPAAEIQKEEEEGHGWALLPGSRPQEIRRLLPILLEVGRILRREEPGVPLRVSVAQGQEGVVKEVLEQQFEIDVTCVQGVEAAVRPSKGALVCSGTATLEVACLGRPMVVVYAAHPITWWLSRRVLRKGAPVALPNIVLGREVVPEVLQHLEPEEIAAALATAQEAGQQAALEGIRLKLGGPGAHERAAAGVVEVLGGPRA